MILRLILLTLAVSDETILLSHRLEQPRMHFLFMVEQNISNLALWSSFWHGQSNWKAYAHCTKGCGEGISLLDGTAFEGIEVVSLDPSEIESIETVETEYCWGLVRPMISLLQAALKSLSSMKDKFIFVSSDALPLKPFEYIYHDLQTRSGSDICTYPPWRWSFKEDGVHFRSHQWVVLNALHAKQAVEVWKEKNSSIATQFANCLDEWWFTEALFGPVKATQGLLKIKGFSGPPLGTADSLPNQGQCDTFVYFNDYENRFEGNTPIRKLGGVFGASERHGKGCSKWVSCYPAGLLGFIWSLRCSNLCELRRLLSSMDEASRPTGGVQRPTYFSKLSNQGLQALRNSDFLFARLPAQLKPCFQGLSGVI